MSDHSRPRKRRHRNPGGAQQPQDAGDLDDLEMGGRWDGAHSGLGGERACQHEPWFIIFACSLLFPANECHMF